MEREVELRVAHRRFERAVEHAPPGHAAAGRFPRGFLAGVRDVGHGDDAVGRMRRGSAAALALRAEGREVGSEVLERRRGGLGRRRPRLRERFGEKGRQQAPGALRVLALALLPGADDQHVLRARRSDVEQPDLFGLVEDALGFLQSVPVAGLAELDDAEPLLGLSDDPPVSPRLRASPIDRETHGRIVLAAGVREEYDRSLEALRPVDGHQPHGPASAGASAHLFDVARVRQSLELGDHASEIEAVHREGAGGRDGLEEVSGAAVAELPGSRVRRPAEARAQARDRGPRRQRAGEGLALAQQLAGARDARVGVLGQSGAEGKASARAEVAVEGLVVHAEQRARAGRP